MEEQMHDVISLDRVVPVETPDPHVPPLDDDDTVWAEDERGEPVYCDDCGVRFKESDTAALRVIDQTMSSPREEYAICLPCAGASKSRRFLGRIVWPERD